ncbi:MAG: hypothetical protein K8J08_10290 [Thermoanaerobaculia bacterium]|nr:hypothetical protein [Thermoanaerobaculia bacterium]
MDRTIQTEGLETRAFELARLVAVVFLWLLLATPPGSCFKGKEHRAISDIALWLAIQDHVQVEPISSLFLDCPLDLEVRQQSCASSSACVPFGVATLTVDRVHRPENLLPFGRVHSSTTWWIDQPSDISERCTRATSRPPSPRGNTPLQRAACQIAEKQGGWLYPLLAAHRNHSHFEACAASAYNEFHGLAFSMARQPSLTADRPWIEPLFAEAVALHFLQDSFAPGHFLTPRGTATDIIARALHNDGNAIGAEAFINRSNLLSKMISDLQTLLHQPSEVPPNVASALSELFPGAAARAQVITWLQGLREKGSQQACFLGDGRLNGRRSRKPQDKIDTGPCSKPAGSGRQPPGHEQAAALVLLSAASISNVVVDGLGSTGVQPSRLDFVPWSAPLVAPLRVDWDNLRRPTLSFQSQLAGDKSSESEPLGGFVSRPKKEFDRFGMSFRHLEVSGAVLVGDGYGASGWRAEVSIPFGSTPETDIRILENGEPRSCDDSEDCTFPKSGFKLVFGNVMSWNVQYDQWKTFDAWGFVVRNQYPFRTKGLGIDIVLGAEIGQKWYESSERKTSKFIWGGQVSVGLGLVFAELGYERGNRLLAGGESDRASYYSLGIGLQIP